MIDVKQYQELRRQGYTDADIQNAVQEQELEASYNQALQKQQADPRTLSSNTIIAGNLSPQNIIEWQLELDSILERVEHLLRGDKPKYIKGNLIFVAPEKEEERVLNEYGVNEVMRLLSLYINRNTILSNYDEFTINYKVYDFGCELSDLLFLKYDEFGMNTPQKRKLYWMLVRELTDTVHSSYLRALNGGERESIRKAISVSQTLDNNQQFMPMQQMQRKKSLLKPWTWFG